MSSTYFKWFLIKKLKNIIHNTIRKNVSNNYRQFIYLGSNKSCIKSWIKRKKEQTHRIFRIHTISVLLSINFTAKIERLTTKDKCMNIKKKKNILNVFHFSLINVSTSGCCNIVSCDSCMLDDAAFMIAIITSIWCFWEGSGINILKSTSICNR